MRKFFSLFLTVLFVTQLLQAQDFSNRGKDFWIAYPSHIDGTASVMGLYITSDQNAVGTIEAGGTTISFTVTANTVTRKFLGPNAAGDAPNTGVHLSSQDGIEVGKGIRVKSDKPVVVYAHIIRSARSGATLVLPVSVLSKEYIIPSYRNVGSQGTNGGYGELAVVATDTNTVVEITPVVNSRNGARAAGVAYTVTLANPGDVYQVQFQQNADISGTAVRSVAVNGIKCKKIAVFSATTWTAFDCTTPVASGGDNLFQQPFPTTSWGKNFLTAPFFSNPLNIDIVRVFVKDPSTIVQKTEAGVTTTLTGLINGSYYEYATGNPTAISADKPASVVMYVRSQNCNTPAVQTDPEMVIINPVEQTINDITVFSAHRNFVPTGQSQVSNHYLNIIIKTAAAASFRINGAAPAASFTVIPGTAYSYLREDVTTVSATNPVHSLKADSAFIAIAYGFGNVESYGYNAGTNVKDLFQFIDTKNSLGTAPFPAACINSPFDFAITFPYQPDSIRWDFGALFPAKSYSLPVADTSYLISGRMVYRYKIAQTYSIPVAGTYPVKVYARNPLGDGCSSDQEIEFDLQVFNPPTTDFTHNSTGCTDSAVVFTSNTNSGGRPIIKHYWDFGDGTTGSVANPSKAYLNPGTYTVKYVALTDIGCISDTVTKTITLTKVPVAKFGILDSLCVGKALTFRDSSSLSGGFGAITSWNWNTGIGGPVTNTSSADVTATYLATGAYTASLQLRTNTGCYSPVYQKTITIRPKPTVDFTLSHGCLPNPVINFNSTSTIADGTQAGFKYLWNFGDPGSAALNTAIVQSPSHSYPSAGPFNVQLQVTSMYGCIDSVTKAADKIYPQPKADFTVPAEVCWQTAITFTDASNGFTHPVTKWEWRFSDGTTSTQKNPVKNFTNPGTYTATLWVFTDQNCVSDTIMKTVVVNPWPTASFTTSTIACEKNVLTFTNTSLANAGNINRAYWDFGDGNTANVNTTSTTHTYTNWGNYTVRFVTETDKGCRNDTLLKNVLINPLPKPGYVLPEVCLNDALALFLDTSSIADNSAAQFTYLWKFNTGSPAIIPGPLPATSTLKNPAVKFNKADNYVLSLTVTSKDGCKDSVVAIPFTVNGSVPNADFTILTTNGQCSNQDIQIKDNSTVDFGSITKVEIIWDNGNAPAVIETDDTPTPGKIYSHLYPDFQTPLTKTYEIRYRAYSGILCVDEQVKTITINASPLTQFTALSAVCVNDNSFQVTQARELGGLQGTGVYSGKGINAAGLFTPANAGVGVHTLRYTFTAANGCVHYSEQTIEVWPKPAVNAGTDITVLEDGIRKITDVTATGAGLQFLWTPATYLDKDTIQLPTIIGPKDDITYLITVTNNFGCVATDDLFVKVLKSPHPPNTFTPNGDGINDFWEIKFINDYPGSVIEVYNTAGTMVYRSVGYNTPWDGKWKGQPLPAGTYYYVIDPKNGRKRMSGYVTILR